MSTDNTTVAEQNGPPAVTMSPWPLAEVTLSAHPELAWVFGPDSATRPPTEAETARDAARLEDPEDALHDWENRGVRLMTRWKAAQPLITAPPSLPVAGDLEPVSVPAAEPLEPLPADPAEAAADAAQKASDERLAQWAPRASTETVPAVPAVPAAEGEAGHE